MWQYVKIWMDKLTEVPSQSFFKTHVPSVKQDEIELPKNKIFKSHVSNMYLTL
jgi:hypothetical protein